MSIKVTREQVSAARIVHALDKVEGRESDEWVLRLIKAKDPTTSFKNERVLREDAPRGAHFEDASSSRSSDREDSPLKARASTRRGKIGTIGEKPNNPY